MALITWLAGITLVTIALAASFISLVGVAPEGEDHVGFGEALWASLMRAMDAGALGGDSGWSFRGVMFVVTMAGIFIFSALIGIITAGLDARLEELRKGRSRVLEQGHTVILNWSPSIFEVLSELAIANASEKAPRIVILAEHDKVAMEDEIRERVPDLGRTKVICRSGDPKSLYDIAIANPGAAKSIIILSPPEEDADTAVIKSLITLINDPAKRGIYNITAEVRDPDNQAIAETIGGDEANIVLADSFIARLIAHSTQSRGLAEVYNELLDFDGCEIYTHRPAGIGADYTFYEALIDYRDCIPIGIVDAAGRITLRPAMTASLGEASLLVVAEDDSKITHQRLDGAARSPAVPKRASVPHETRPTSILILGWNQRGAQCVEELLRINQRGSRLTIASNAGEAIAIDPALVASCEARLEILDVDIRHRKEIVALDPLGYETVIALGYSDTLSEQAADTVTLLCLLHLRELIESAGESAPKPRIISEMCDVKNRALAEITKADDFVVSNKMLSLLMAQSSENRHVFGVFSQLLSGGGSDVELRDITMFADAGTSVDFAALQVAAAELGECAIGYLTHESGAVPVVNPAKSALIEVRAGNLLITVA